MNDNMLQYKIKLAPNSEFFRGLVEEDGTIISHFYTTAKDFAMSIAESSQSLPERINPRSHDGNKCLLHKTAKAIRRTLNEEPKNFSKKNKGVTILPKNVIYDKETRMVTVCFGSKNEYDSLRYNPKFGIIDGMTTASVIKDIHTNRPDVDISKAIMRLEIIEGITDRNLINEIAVGRNLAQPVKSMSIMNSKGNFDNVKNILKGQSYAKDIGYEENATCKINISKITGIFALASPFWAVNSSKSPTDSYCSRAKMLRYYDENDDEYGEKRVWFNRVINDLGVSILQLHDEIIVGIKEYCDSYKKSNGELPKGFNDYSDNPKHTLFTNSDKYYSIDECILFPLLFGLFGLIGYTDPDDALTWSINPIDFWNKNKNYLLKKINEMINKHNYNILEMGKKKAPYRDLREIVTNLMTKQLINNK